MSLLSSKLLFDSFSFGVFQFAPKVNPALYCDSLNATLPTSALASIVVIIQIGIDLDGALSLANGYKYC